MSKKIFYNNIIFYFAYFIILFAWVFSNVKYVDGICDILLKVSYIILSALFLLKINRLSKKELIISLIIFAVSFISWRISTNPTFFILYLLVLNSKDIDLKKLIVKDYKIKLIFLLIIIILYYLGYTNSFVTHRSNGILRSSMGFAHPNIFGSYVFSIYCEYIYIHFKKIKSSYLLVMSLLISFIIAYFTDSRSTYLSIIIMCMMLLIYRYKLFNFFDKKYTSKLLSYSVIICLALSLFLSLRYSPTSNLYLKIDEIFSGRIRFANMFLNSYPITLFGNKLTLVSTYVAASTGQKSLVLDNSYIHLILQFGIISSIIFVFHYITANKRLYENKDYLFVIILFVSTIRALTETVLYVVYFNIFLLYIGNIIFKENKNPNEIDII